MKTSYNKSDTTGSLFPRALLTQQGVNRAIKQVCDILRRSNCAGALQYVPELTWMLFLRILDERETREAEEAEAVGQSYAYSLQAPYRWQDWAAPGGSTRVELTTVRPRGSFFDFINTELLPYLKDLENQPNAHPRQRVITEILSGVEKTRVDTEKNLLDVLDKLHSIREEAIDPTHVFPLSQVFEGLLLKMGEKGNDGGQFFTPREVIRLIIQVLNPTPGQTVYDPSCGTAGFLAQAYDYLLPQCDVAVAVAHDRRVPHTVPRAAEHVVDDRVVDLHAERIDREVVAGAAVEERIEHDLEEVIVAIALACREPTAQRAGR